jgi:hypothetical protein
LIVCSTGGGICVWYVREGDRFLTLAYKLSLARQYLMAQQIAASIADSFGGIMRKMWVHFNGFVVF